MDSRIVPVVCVAALAAGSLCAAAEAQGDVVFRDCPKCKMLIRISDDAKTAFVNESCQGEPLPLAVREDVKIERGGRRTLVFRCSSPEARSFFVQIDGGEKVRLEVPATDGAFAEVSTESDFTPGVHSVRVSNSAGWAPDIDAMTLR